MNQLKRFVYPALVVLLVCSSAAAQPERTQRSNRPPEMRTGSMYRLSFTIHIVEGTRDQTRAYTLILHERSGGKLRALTKVPVKQGPETNYVETGVKCDAQYQEVEGRVRLELEVHYSDIAVSADQVAGDPPSIHEWQSRVEATVEPNETTLLSSYEGGGDNRRYQLEVKAEKLK